MEDREEVDNTEEKYIFLRNAEDHHQGGSSGGEGGDDTSFLTWMLENRILIIGVIVVLLILKFSFKDLRHRWFAAFMEFMTKSLDAKTAEMKKDVFATLGSTVSHDPALRKIGALKILEIGVGTGTNFAYYPEGTHLIVVDPNPHFRKYYDANRKKFPNIQSEDILISTGEEMDMIPDNSVDVVVVTLVFCSVVNTPKMLKQILRVLVPGGKFYFYEHILEFDTTNHGLRRKIQTLLTDLGIWPLIFDNCHLNRDMLEAIEATGFSKVQAQRFYAPIESKIFQVIRPSLKGVAEK